MSKAKSVTEASLNPVYVVVMMVIIIASMISNAAVPWLVALSVHGPVSIKDVLTTRVPVVDQTALWGKKLVVPQVEVNILNPGMSQHSFSLVDSATHEVKSVDVRIPVAPFQLVSDKDSLWIVTAGSVIELNDTISNEVKPFRKLGSSLNAFVVDGNLYTIDQSTVADSIDGFREVFELLKWSGQDWVAEGRILCPRKSESGDIETADKSSGDASSFGGTDSIRVGVVGSTVHLFCTDGSGIELHTEELVVVPDGAVSVLEAENSRQQIPDWLSTGRVRPASLIGKSAESEQFGRDKQGLLLLESNRTFSGIKMTNQLHLFRFVDGKWNDVRKWERTGMVLSSRLVSDGETAHLVNQSISNKLVLSSLEEGSSDVQLHFNSHGFLLEKMTKTAATWGTWIALPVLFLFVLAASRLMKVYRNPRYEFGNSDVQLASVTRRVVAKGIDTALISLPFYGLQWWWFKSPVEMQEWLAEQVLSGDLNLISTLIFGVLGILVYFVLWLIGIGVAEGAWGISPGKWMCDIRVVRTTLRPCGFLRAVLREILYLVDAVMCMGWMPGACCVAFTPNWQRVGDLVADTIVIRRPSRGEPDSCVMGSDNASVATVSAD